MSNDSGGRQPRTGVTMVRSAWQREDPFGARPRTRDEDAAAAATLRALARLEDGLVGARRALDGAITAMTDRALGTSPRLH